MNSSLSNKVIVRLVKTSSKMYLGMYLRKGRKEKTLSKSIT